MRQPDYQRIARLQAEIMQRYERRILQLEAELAEERARYTRGGIPPGYAPWANEELPPPSTADPNRTDLPALRRGYGPGQAQEDHEEAQEADGADGGDHASAASA